MNKIITLTTAIASIVIGKQETYTTDGFLGKGSRLDPEEFVSVFKKNSDGTFTKMSQEPRPLSMPIEKSHAKLKDGRILKIPHDFDEKEHQRRQLEGHPPFVARDPNGTNVGDLIGDFQSDLVYLDKWIYTATLIMGQPFQNAKRFLLDTVGKKSVFNSENCSNCATNTKLCGSQTVPGPVCSYSPGVVNYEFPFQESQSTSHTETPGTLKEVTIMDAYHVGAYDAVDYICMNGALWDKGYIMCLHQYHYMSVQQNLNTNTTGEETSFAQQQDVPGVFAIGRENSGTLNVDPVPTGFLATAAYFGTVPNNMMSVIVTPTGALNAIYMGAINETAYEGNFVWVNMTELDGPEYIGNMVGISVAGVNMMMPPPLPGRKYNRAAFQIGYPYYGVPTFMFNQIKSILTGKFPDLVCTTFCVIPRLCSAIPTIPEISLHFDERYDFRIAFSSVENDIYYGHQANGKCYVEIYDVGDTDIFQIGDPFFKEYYTVFSANNSTMGFGLSIERNQLDKPVITDTTPNAPAPGPMTSPPNELKPDALPPTVALYTGPSPMPEGADKNVAPLAAAITAGGIFLFLVIVMSYFFCCRKERPDEQSNQDAPDVYSADGRVRLTGMNPRFDDLNVNLDTE